MSLESPEQLHTFLIESMRPLLPEGVDVDKHFTPRYRPWQQRIAVVPDGDLFAAMREGKASIVTDTIDTFTENGIKICSGEEIPADIVVTATGFDLSLLGDVAFTVDGEPVDFTKRVTWRGTMISGVPNMAYVFGYFRHSWTLRVDLVGDLVCRLLAHMQEQGRHDGGPDPATRGRGHAAAAVVRPGELQRRLRHALAAPLVQAGRPRTVDPHARVRAGAGDPAQGRPRRRDARLPLSPSRAPSPPQRGPTLVYAARQRTRRAGLAPRPRTPTCRARARPTCPLPAKCVRRPTASGPTEGRTERSVRASVAPLNLAAVSARRVLRLRVAALLERTVGGGPRARKRSADAADDAGRRAPN